MTDSLSGGIAGGYAAPPPHKFTEFFGTGTKYGRFGDASDDPDTMILKRDQLKAGIDSYSKGMGTVFIMWVILEKMEKMVNL